jgi:hypothetical protein
VQSGEEGGSKDKSNISMMSSRPDRIPTDTRIISRSMCCLPFSSLRNLLLGLLAKRRVSDSQSATNSQHRRQSLKINNVQNASLPQGPINRHVDLSHVQLQRCSFSGSIILN